MEDLLDDLSAILELLENSLDEINKLTTEITEIPAPPFKEEKRASFVNNYFEKLGYKTEIDTAGNVLAYHGTYKDKVILSAHLDTVFDNNEITVTVDGDFLRAPGVGDDSRGLANILVIAKLLSETHYAKQILFVATVGEEGLGDLRGVKQLFAKDDLSPVAFVTIDGTGTSRIVNQGIGSLRYRLWFKGPGGHSFGSFGTVNPAYALGSFMQDFATLEILPKIKSTFSLGVIGGGTSINAIPEKVHVDIDLRSETKDGLEKMRQQVFSFAEQSAMKETETRQGLIEFEFEDVGNRPPGMPLADSHLQKIVKDIHDVLDLEINFTASSTDANVPLSMGIPAISVGGVEQSGRAHTQDEWILADQSSLLPVKRNLILICALAKDIEELK